MPTPERLAEQFEEHRPHVRAVAYRMLGSVHEAEDAVQEAWIRLSRTDVSGVDNLRGWLTTVVARVCLDMLRTRASRREDPLDVHVPDPIIRAVSFTAYAQLGLPQVAEMFTHLGFSDYFRVELSWVKFSAWCCCL